LSDRHRRYAATAHAYLCGADPRDGEAQAAVQDSESWSRVQEGRRGRHSLPGLSPGQYLKLLEATSTTITTITTSSSSSTTTTSSSKNCNITATFATCNLFIYIYCYFIPFIIACNRYLFLNINYLSNSKYYPGGNISDR